ncbi:DUF3152 domain-containing protein [Streptomyces sp. 7R007]
MPGVAGGTPSHGVPRASGGTPAHGVPRVGGAVSAQGGPRVTGATPPDGTPQVRGGHPEQREAGGGWGELGRPQPRATVPRQRQAPSERPRQDYIDAFAEESVGVRSEAGPDQDDAPPTAVPAQQKGAKGRTFTGIAAAAVTTVLAVVVAGQVTHRGDETAVHTQSATGQARDVRNSAVPSVAPSPSATPLTYEQKMDQKYALSATLKGSGKFDTVPGTDKAPGKGQKYTYRVDVEQGLGLDGALFAQAVQKTLNDDRSWAHDGARTFERVSSGKPDFVITLASPGTTATWCAKSGLDTTEDNVSCDSAATERVMINAYRWAQGSKTYGDEIHAYRQMLINHEVGHRLGYHHVTCEKDGQLAPVMQQQTKFLDHDGIHCLPNPWPYPRS